MDEKPLLSAEDQADVEALYDRLTTPLRCRIGLHKWTAWEMAFGLQVAAKKETGKKSPVFGVDVDYRLCEDCVKVQTRVRNQGFIDPTEMHRELDEEK